MEKANQMIFDTQVNKDALKLAQQFLTSLLEHNMNSMSDYADIHIYQEEALIIIEWVQVFYDDDFPQEHFILKSSEEECEEEEQ